MGTMTGGEAACVALRSLGVRHVFGIVSVHNLPIYDAIRRREGIRVFEVRHEAAGVHAADAYARVTGKLGVVVTSTGPGAANAVPGLYEAAFASSPVLMLTGQVETAHYGKGKGVLHEAEGQLAMLRSVTRRAESPRYADEIAPAILAVARDVQTGRPQPGAVEIPIDLQYAETAASVPDPVPPVAIEPAPEAIEAAAARLALARRVVIFSGGGVIRGAAWGELVALAEELGAPVFTTVNGRGAIPEDHPLGMGPIAHLREMRDVVAEADVLLAVGTRFQGGGGGVTPGWRLRLPETLIHLDVDPRVLGLNYAPDVAILSDAGRGLAALRDALGATAPDTAFATRAREVRDRVRATMRAQIGADHAAIMDALRVALPRDANLVRDSTVPAYLWGDRLLPVLVPRTSLHPSGAAIGPGLPFAIGAALASGRKTVVIQGDGGFMLHIGELATAAQLGVPIVVCLFNDRGYGVLRRIQQSRFEGATIGVDLSTPDFAAVARAMGVRAETVKGVEAFRDALARAVDASGPVLLDIDLASLAPMPGFAVPPPARS